LDEVTSALDPTVSLQILDVITRLKEEQGTGIILITHDLSIALEVCDRVAVMQKGCIVETGTVREIFDKPVHPYTNLLVSSV
jgi:peptide/nickel transport system ATP-binding protein